MEKVRRNCSCGITLREYQLIRKVVDDFISVIVDNELPQFDGTIRGIFGAYEKEANILLNRKEHRLVKEFLLKPNWDKDGRIAVFSDLVTGKTYHVPVGNGCTHEEFDKIARFVDCLSKKLPKRKRIALSSDIYQNILNRISIKQASIKKAIIIMNSTEANKSRYKLVIK